MTITAWIRSVTDRWERGTRPSPVKDLQPTVEWQVNGVCNYDCSYCIQSRVTRSGAPGRRTVERIVDGFAQLPGIWEIKMSGGEPFAFSGLMEWVIPGLMDRTGHLVSILTNFSAPLQVLERFCALTGDRLRITSASFHPERTGIDQFIAKAVAYRALRDRHNPRSSFVVNVVLVPGHVAEHLAFRDRLRAFDLGYFPQLMKIKGGVYPYSREDRVLIEQLTEGSRDPHQVNRAPNYRGLHCEAGVWYFVVDQRGEAYTCRTGKRFQEEDSRARLGNIAAGSFALRLAGGPCPYPICPCTVPVNRGIVRLPAEDDTGANHGI